MVTVSAHYLENLAKAFVITDVVADKVGKPHNCRACNRTRTTMLSLRSYNLCYSHFRSDFMATSPMPEPNSELAEFFRSNFFALTDYSPYPWQESLFLFMVEGEQWNKLRNISLPTGTGKTAIMAIWLLALVWEAAHAENAQGDRKSTCLNSSHIPLSRMSS